MPKYLQKRRRRWYAVMDIPKALRPKLGGSPRFVQSLETESLTEAEARVHWIIASWKEQLAAARGENAGTREDIIRKALSWREDLCKSEHDEDQHIVLKSVLDDNLWDIDREDSKTAKLAAMIAYGETYPLDRDIEAWLATQELEAKTIDMKRSDAVRFVARFKLSHEVNREGLLNWVHQLQVTEGLKAPTVRRIISACRGYWDYLHLAGHLRGQETIFDRVSPKKATKSKSAVQKKRQAFDIADVSRLITKALDNDDQQLARLIWLGIWTGCRIEELCGLQVSSVHPDHFVVTDAKTSAGLRVVPVHPRLHPLLHHLCANSKDGYVLSGLTFNKYEDRSNAIGKRFGRLKTAMGYDTRYVFHSIRKTVATEFENLDVPENVAADIIGHEKKTMTYGLYSKGNRLPALNAAVRKLAFPLDPAIEKRLLKQ
jgi:integrase